MTELEQKRPCPTCGRPWSWDAFYMNCTECKDCKRLRSQRNRALQARKLAALERLAEAFVSLADRAAEPPGELKPSLTSEVG